MLAGDGWDGLGGGSGLVVPKTCNNNKITGLKNVQKII